MDISIYNWTSGEFITLNSRSISLSFARSTGVRDLIKWNDLLDEDNGYIQVWFCIINRSEVGGGVG